MKTYFHPEQLLHDPKTYLSRGQMRTPQEVPDRALAILRAVRALGFDVNPPEDFGMQALLAVHTEPYLAFLQGAYSAWKRMPADWGDEVMSNVFVREPNALRGILAQAAAYLADGSCPVGEFTWRSAYWSAQCAVAASNDVLAGARMSYALCRPPGHHARAAAAGGFCYLNNAAIAAQHLRQRFSRVAIFDADVHHGQGVQEIFYERNDVFYASVHADPTNFYPVVAGHADETGRGAGAGFNLNLPLPHGSPEDVFFDQVERALSAVRAFKPEALVFSLGFDIYKDDPQSRVAVSSAGFHRLGKAVASLDLPTVLAQEGGYHIETLAHHTEQFFNGLMGRQAP